MDELLTSFCETLLERFKPLITIPRISCFFLLVLLTTPDPYSAISIETLRLGIGAATEKIVDAFLKTPIGYGLAIALGVFIIVPLLTSYVIRALIRFFHLRRGQTLIANLKATSEQDEAYFAAMKNDQISALFTRGERGKRTLGRQRALAEILLYVAMAILLALIGDSVTFRESIALTCLVIAALFYVSQRMFVCYLAEIQPYQVVSERLRNISR